MTGGGAAPGRFPSAGAAFGGAAAMRRPAAGARPGGGTIRIAIDPIVAGAVVLSITVGLGVGLGSSRGYDLFVLGLICAPLALLFPVPAYLWALGAVCAVALSRLVVEIGAPGMVNHVHFGMALVAAARGLMSRPAWTPLARRLAGTAGGLLLACYVSALTNDGGVLRPGLAWLLLVEPFLVLFALVREPPEGEARRRAGHLLVALLVLQLPFSVWKFLDFGISDAVRGTFLHQGAGAHVMGAMVLVSAMGALLTGHVRNRGWRIALIALALLLNILADAKQAVGMYLIALATIGLLNSPRHWPRYVVGLAAAIGVVFFAARYHPALRQFTDADLLERGLRSKVSVVPLIGGHFESPVNWLFGAGPGNTVSRIALMALDEYRIDNRSSGMPFDFPTSRVTRLVWYENEVGALSGEGGSSAWSLIASWVGIWGDTGIIGVCLYILLGVLVWREARALPRGPSNMVRIAVLFVGLLGFVYSYLEEPGLTLVTAAWIGMACCGPRRGAAQGDAADARAARP